MKKIDQIVDAYYSPEVETLKTKAWKSVKRATITGGTAAILFGMITIVIFSAFLLQYNPLKNGLSLVILVLGIPLVVVLIPTSWFFAARYLWNCKKAKEAVDEIMRNSKRSEPDDTGQPT